MALGLERGGSRAQFCRTGRRHPSTGRPARQRNSSQNHEFSGPSRPIAFRTHSSSRKLRAPHVSCSNQGLLRRFGGRDPWLTVLAMRCSKAPSGYVRSRAQSPNDTANRGVAAPTPTSYARRGGEMAPRNEIGHEMVVLSEAASSRIASGEGASRPALLPFPGVHLGVRVVSPRLRGKRAKRPRPRHGDLNAPGASQSIESCKHRSSSAAAGGLTAGIGQPQPRARHRPA